MSVTSRGVSAIPVTWSRASLEVRGGGCGCRSCAPSPCNTVAGVEKNGVVEGERGKMHRVLLSALGVALDAVASAARVRLRTRVERVRDGTHEPCVGRDAFLCRGSLDADLERLGETQRDAPAQLLPGRRLNCIRCASMTTTRLRLATRESNLDPSCSELAADLEGCFPKRVEEPEVEGRAESLAQPLRGLGRCFVAQSGGAGEVSTRSPGCDYPAA